MYDPDPYAGQLDDKSISFKNRNPLNLRPGGGDWQGMTGTMTHPRAGAFLMFDSVENGYRAAAITLINYGRLFGADTIAKIVARWAPPSENDTAAYVAAVEAATQIGRDVRLRLLQEPDALARIMDAMTRVESGGHQPYRAETIREGIRRAYRRFGRMVGDCLAAERITVREVHHGQATQANAAAHGKRPVPKKSRRQKAPRRKASA